MTGERWQDLLKGILQFPSLNLLEQDWYPMSGIGWPYLEREGNGICGFWWSLIPFCLLGNLTREVDLVCASEGLVTIVTCSSGEAGNIVAGQGIGEEWTTFWLCIDWFLIAATENGHAQQGDWIYWYPELAGHCISLELMEMLFPITSNTAITVSCKRLLTMAVSVLLALLLGIIETDGMLGLQILRDLRSPSSSFNLITSSLKTSSSLSKHQ